MRVAFLYPRPSQTAADNTRAVSQYDSLVTWIDVVRRHCKRHEVLHLWPLALGDWGITTADIVLPDIVFPITQGEVYPAPLLNAHIGLLQMRNIPFGIIHNQDCPRVPEIGDYPSFAWTECAVGRLDGYNPILVRQPVLPRLPEAPLWTAGPLHLATFGHIEPKKWTLPMAGMARKLGVKFTAFAPELFAEKYGHYIREVQALGNVVTYGWVEHVEDLGPMFDRLGVTHFIFYLPPSKGGDIVSGIGGGSPTCPRYAAGFGRPVIVIDDEHTFVQDGFYVLKAMTSLSVKFLREMTPPDCKWTPDEYVDALVKHTLEFYRKETA